MRLLLALLLTLACGDEPEPDAALYARATALSASHPEEAARLCLRLSDGAARGDCLLFTARASADDGGDGLAICELGGPGPWRDACVFELVDRRGLAGEEGRAACTATGRYMDECEAHVLQRDVDLLLARSRPDGLGGLAAELEAVIAAAQPGRDARAEARLLVAAAIASAASAEGQISEARCADVDLETCALALRVLAIWRMDGAPNEGSCEAVAPGVGVGLETLLEEARAAMCDTRQAQALARDLGRWRIRRRAPGTPYGPSSPLLTPPARSSPRP